LLGQGGQPLLIGLVDALDFEAAEQALAGPQQADGRAGVERQ
jgi:hypothetical protein